MSLPSLVAAVDDLYRSVVLDPGRWGEQAFAEWIDGVVATTPPTPSEARELRRAVRAAVKLARFWSSPAAGGHAAEADWERRVDIAVGPAAWRPTLQLGLLALEESPSADLFAHVAARFRLVNHAPFASGLGYDEWLGGADPR